VNSSDSVHGENATLRAAHLWGRRRSTKKPSKAKQEQ
jgi:hypothetical protein